jgi:hypothetical protein
MSTNAGLVSGRQSLTQLAEQITAEVGVTTGATC